MTTNPDEMAFPVPETDGNHFVRGMTKREKIAAMALQGMGTWSPVPHEYSSRLTDDDTLDERSRWAVRQADSLIKALNEVKP